EQFDVANRTAKFDLTLALIETQQGLEGVLEYNADLFDAGTIRRMAEHFRILLADAVANPEQTIGALPLLTVAEREQVLVAWNDTAVEYPSTACVHELIAAQADRTPDAVAVVCGDERLTYRELNARANQVAHYLRKLDVGPDTLVGLMMERSAAMVVGLLGILNAGGAYVPIDPSYPAERIEYMLQHSEAPVVLAEERLVANLPPAKAQVVCLDRDWETMSRESDANPLCTAQPGNLAYVIYTSGSTGRPKGVQIEHRTLVNFLWSMREQPGLTADDRLVAVTSISFDIAGLELYLPLLTGAQVVVASREVAADAAQLSALLAESGATVMQATPATWQMLRNTGWQNGGRVRVLVGGEALPRDLAAWMLAGAESVWNLYGPTETTIWSAVSRITSATGAIPLGRPIANTKLYVLDERQQPVPVGVAGELYIGGDGLARGYLHRPDLTSERFLADPFSPEPEARMYKTGDLVRYRADGTLEFLGRTDFQVKIRGYRIELGEIEATLALHPAVREAVVAVRQRAAGDKRLVAYLSAAGEQPTAAAMRHYLREHLPEYMVPSAFVWLEAMPLTPNGKVDRKALPAPEAGDEMAAAHTDPQTPVEEILVGIWAEVLGVPRVSIHDNFFELGGHSLLATQVLARIRDSLGADLPVRAMFERPTVAGLAALVEASLYAGGTPSAPIIPVDRAGELPLSFAQQRLWFLDQLEPASSAYNIPMAMRLKGELDRQALERTVNEVVRRHEALRTTFTVREGHPLVTIAAELVVDLPLVSLADLAESEREAEAMRLVEEEAERPFDLARGPLLRGRLLRLAEAEHILILTMHHIVSDGWSLGVLTNELTVLYTAFVRDESSPLLELPIQYADYAAWQRQWLQGEALDEQLGYWKRQLGGEL
ncbi:MAG TPA: amino acid adenylation domain-containing protein, partial [Symbiobacteriaceae bacterium]|nr:amino acid adenylation domain-containing protein [Symbiobacteriaceae bacterium]